MRLLQVPWGESSGPARRLAPESRVIAWVGAMVACFAADPVTSVGLGTIGFTVLLMELLTLAPLRVLIRAVLVATVMIGPVFLLSPWTTAEVPVGVIGLFSSVVAPARVFLRGLCVLVVTSQLVSILTRSEFRDALARLPVPSLLAAVAQQVLLQAELQTAEARRIGLALRARGATRGMRNRLRVGFGLPGMWLGRLLFKAQRNTWAMEARGFSGEPFAFTHHPWRARDIACLLGASAWAFAALWLRWRGGS